MVVQEQKQAAELLGVTARTIRDWRDQHPDFPDCTNGHDIEAIKRWIAAHGSKGSDRAGQAEQLNLAKKAQELRKLKAAADKAEREEQIARGNILPRDEYETAMVEVITLARDRLLSMPKQLSRLVRQQDQRRLQIEGDKLVRKILDEMGRQLETMEPAA